MLTLPAPVATAVLPSSVARSGSRPLRPGDRYLTASSLKPPGLSLCKEPGSQAEGPSTGKSLGSRGRSLRSQLQGMSCVYAVPLGNGTVRVPCSKEKNDLPRA